jgi:hypothetical protein
MRQKTTVFTQLQPMFSPVDLLNKTYICVAVSFSFEFAADLIGFRFFYKNCTDLD